MLNFRRLKFFLIDALGKKISCGHIAYTGVAGGGVWRISAQLAYCR